MILTRLLAIKRSGGFVVVLVAFVDLIGTVGDEGDSHGAASLEGEIEPSVLLLTDKKATEVLRIGVPVR